MSFFLWRKSKENKFSWDTHTFWCLRSHGWKSARIVAKIKLDCCTGTFISITSLPKNVEPRKIIHCCHDEQLTMRFLNLLKSHWQISTPSRTKPVTDAKRVRIIWNYMYTRLCWSLQQVRMTTTRRCPVTSLLWPRCKRRATRASFRSLTSSRQSSISTCFIKA